MTCIILNCTRIIVPQPFKTRKLTDELSMLMLKSVDCILAEVIRKLYFESAGDIFQLSSIYKNRWTVFGQMCSDNQIAKLDRILAEVFLKWSIKSMDHILAEAFRN